MIKVAILLMLDMRLATKTHPKAEPVMVAGARRSSPAPPALCMHHPNNPKPARGATIALRVKKWRIEWRGK